MIFVICGPTGAGKSALALRLAQDFDGEIINGDAYQVYRGMDIGTAKPTPDEQALVPHHLFDILDVNQPFSVADYQKYLREVIANRENDQHPLFIVGGNGLYVKAALFDYDFQTQKEFDTSIYDHLNNEELHRELAKVDSLSAEKFHMNNRRRVLRALAIYHQTGLSKSAIESQQKHQLLYPVHFIGLMNDRQELYERINHRVDQMISQGLVDEVLHLYEKYPTAKQAFQAIGYKEIINGYQQKEDLSEVIAKIKQHTRNYAKRQLIFYRTQLPVQWYQTIEEIYNAVKILIEEQTA